jgi:hypothetical protein
MEEHAVLESLLNESESLRPTDPSAAIKAALRAITMARNIKHLAGQTRAYYILSSIYLNIDDFRKAITYAGLSIRFAQQHGYFVHLAGALCIRASSEVRLLQIKRAATDFLDAMDFLTRMPDLKVEGYLYKSIATMLRGLMRLEYVDMASELSVSKYAQLESKLYLNAGLGAQMHNLAEVLRFLPSSCENQKMEAAQKLEKLLGRFDFENENRTPVADALQARADFYSLTGNPEGAQRDYRSITAIADAFQMKNAKTFAIARSAQLYAETGEMELSKIQIDRAEKLRETGRNKFEDLIILESLVVAATITAHGRKDSLLGALKKLTERRKAQTLAAGSELGELEIQIKDAFEEARAQNSLLESL